MTDLGDRGPTRATRGDIDRWTRVKARLRAELGEKVFSSWFGSIELDRIHDTTVHLTVPTKFLKGWIQTRYADRLLVCWKTVLEPVARIKLETRSAALRNMSTSPQSARTSGSAHKVRTCAMAHMNTKVSGPAPKIKHKAIEPSPLNPQLTFGTFIIGESNTLAHAAARQVAATLRGEAVVFNQLYIHARVGMGKTHLLQGIAWAGNQIPGHRVLYLTAETLMHEFLATLDKQTPPFWERLCASDVLLIDDFQFLGSRSIQSELCRAFNALKHSGRQIVLSADRSPSDLDNLDDRLRSRLLGSVVAEIKSPDESLRLEILESRLKAVRTHYPGFDVAAEILKFIAQTVIYSARDLHSALNHLVAHNELTGHPVTIEIAEYAVRDLMRPRTKRVKIEDIQRLITREYNITRGDLLSARRSANVVRPRQIAMYLAKTLTSRSLTDIGRRFGDRDHTTVIHAVQKINTQVDTNKALAHEIDALKQLLQTGE
jgi:chromosomal replication initiator protein